MQSYCGIRHCCHDLPPNTFTVRNTIWRTSARFDSICLSGFLIVETRETFEIGFLWKLSHRCLKILMEWRTIGGNLGLLEQEVMKDTRSKKRRQCSLSLSEVILTNLCSDVHLWSDPHNWQFATPRRIAAHFLVIWAGVQELHKPTQVTWSSIPLRLTE